jgi:hypothetical protein
MPEEKTGAEKAMEKLMDSIISAVADGVKENLGVDETYISLDFLQEEVKKIAEGVASRVAADDQAMNAVAKKIAAKLERAIDEIDPKKIGEAVSVLIAEKIVNSIPPSDGQNETGRRGFLAKIMGASR